MTQIGVLQLRIDPSHVDNEGSGYQIFASRRAVRDFAARCRLGWQEQYLLGYGEVAEPIVKDGNANNMEKRAKNRYTSGSLKHEGKNEEEQPMKVVEAKTSQSMISLRSMQRFQGFYRRRYGFNLIQLVAWSLLVCQTNLTIFGVLLPSKRWLSYLLELISFGPKLMSPFMGVFMFMCPLRSRITKSTMQSHGSECLAIAV
uniref:Uncharacterized protein n=1 Tax=Solanum lycopersicum TaxID=4081 RepID=K4DEM4_SOLLC